MPPGPSWIPTLCQMYIEDAGSRIPPSFPDYTVKSDTDQYIKVKYSGVEKTTYKYTAVEYILV